MNKTKIKKLEKLLSSPQKITIIPHKNPDGDALGSSLGLMQYLNNKSHHAVIISPNDYPEFLKWLPGEKSILKFSKNEKITKKILKESSLIFVLDFNDLKRVGDLNNIIESSKSIKIMIDHHKNPKNFADLNFSFPEISSTCEIVYNIIYSLDSFFINKDIATCLYTGIMTDTGSFKYPSTTSKTHKIISKLIEYGANGSKIYEKIYDEFSLNKLKLLSICLNNIKKVEKLPVVYMTLNQKELDNCSFKKGDSEGFVNYGLSIKGIKLSIILIENKDEKIIKMSFRSKGNFPTNLFAEKFFNGGGHSNASGGSSKENLKKTVSKLSMALNDFNYEF